MSVSFLPAIDVSIYKSDSRGLSTRDLSYLKTVYAKTNDTSIVAAFNHLQETLGRYETLFDVHGVSDIEDIISLLDCGAAKVFVTLPQIEELYKREDIDKTRVVLSKDAHSATVIQNCCCSVKRALHLNNVSDWMQVIDAVGKRSPADGYGDHGPVFVTLKGVQDGDFREAVLQLSSAGAIPIIPKELLTYDVGKYPRLISAPDLLMANAITDRPDGLLSTLVTDERGIALGLVYSSTESVTESLKTGRGVYQSRKRGLWYKGETSGDIQELVNISFDCDHDCLKFTVRQRGDGFCHLKSATCFGRYKGLARLQETLKQRKHSAPAGSYTSRLYNDPELLSAKIREEAEELCAATEKGEIAAEMADLIYFALTKCIANGVNLEDVEQNLDAKSVKVKRRKGDAKDAYKTNGASTPVTTTATGTPNATNGLSSEENISKSKVEPADNSNDRIVMARYNVATSSSEVIAAALQRPSQKSNEKIMSAIRPIIEDVKEKGDSSLLYYTHHFEKATSLKSPVIFAPFPDKLMQLSKETIAAIDTSFNNVRTFHAAQAESKPLQVETMPGVVCSRFSRPIERVGLYVPGGTAVLPSTAMMLGVPALVAGCKKIVVASPPRSDGSISPEIVYIAHKIGAESIVLAGGAQAIAALAYGTQSVSKVDKILGPGNQYVTSAKMIVANDTNAGVSIDMPAGPSEVLVVADKTSNPAFVASDLLSQAEHGDDSQVVLIAIDLTDEQMEAIANELHDQALALPRVDYVRGAIENSVAVQVPDVASAMKLSNQYAPEHLILQCADPEKAVDLVQNAGSIFIGPWTPESVGDYSAGVNHSLPTYGYARQYSGVNLAYFTKHITSSKLSEQGLRNVGGAVMQMASVEELEAHRRAVEIRLDYLDGKAR